MTFTTTRTVFRLYNIIIKFTFEINPSLFLLLFCCKHFALLLFPISSSLSVEFLSEKTSSSTASSESEHSERSEKSLPNSPEARNICLQETILHCHADLVFNFSFLAMYWSDHLIFFV